MAKDIYHKPVKRALQKNGWTITHDPFHLKYGGKRFAADLGAERLISAEKGLKKIVVEIKSFVGRSPMRDLEQAVGQYILYHKILTKQKSDRQLYLAVNEITYRTIFNKPIGRLFLADHTLNLLVFDEDEEKIIQWIPK